MRRKVKNAAELRKMALAKGATVTGKNGKKFNASKTVAKPKPKPKPAAAPAGPTHDEVLAAGLENIAVKLGASQEVTLGTLKHVRQQIDAMAFASPARVEPHGWVFDVRRNDKDQIEQIIAKPTRDS